MTRLLCAILLLCAGYAAADARVSSLVGACFGTDGETVTTTYLGGSAAYYPAPQSATIEQHEDGFTVVHTVRFRQRGAVWLPVVVR